jgi:hypothetical protein
MIVLWIEPVACRFTNSAKELLDRARLPRRSESAPLVEVGKDDDGGDAISPDLQPASLAQSLNAGFQRIGDALGLRARARRQAVEREEDAGAQRQIAETIIDPATEAHPGHPGSLSRSAYGTARTPATHSHHALSCGRLERPASGISLGLMRRRQRFPIRFARLSLHRSMPMRSIAAALLLATACAPARSPKPPAPSAHELAPGVTYTRYTDPRGPWAINLVRADLHRAGIEVRGARAHDGLKGRERVTDMVRRANATGVRVLAAVNADFFNLESGENENNQVIDGEWWKGLKVTDSPYDTWDNPHIQFGLDAMGRPLMDRFILDGKAWDHGAVTPVLTVNSNPTGRLEGTALYTSRFGATTPRDTARRTVEASLSVAGRRGDTLLFVRRGTIAASSGSAIPDGGAVLAAYGTGLRSDEVKAMTEGDTVRVLLATVPRIPHGAAPRMLIGGWPRILRDGVNVAAAAPTEEGTLSRNAELRHPRTAIGFSRDSSTLFLLTVDGRSENSGGMTLVELASVMRELGAWQAMNFDGGGSTTMVVDGRVVNRPSDKEGEREVGNALLVVIR